ncbi:MAG: hypothetical protein HC784_14720 [Hydrococcus sp. CSU_1_8]|nr:hypothetical protein [Hydrococcus sp. CSU_1_8]
MRWRAAEALGKLGTAAQHLVSALTTAAKDPDGRVKRAAIAALAKLARQEYK